MTHLPTKVLETERLLLRQMTLEDLENLCALNRAAATIQCLPGVPQTCAETRDELAEIIGEYDRFGFGLWATIDRETDAFIGCCGLRPRLIEAREEVEVVCTFAPQYWGQGLTTEAARAIIRYGFEHLHLPRIICLIQRENEAAVKIAQKIGMVFAQEANVAGEQVLLYSVSPTQPALTPLVTPN